MSVEFVTERLRCHPFNQEDRPAMGDLLTNREIARTYMLPDFDSEEAVDRLFGRYMELSRQNGRYVAGIYLDNELIGFFNDVENDGSRIELGYVISPTHWGKGFATEMLRGAVEDLFHCGYGEVVAGAFEENKASMRVMEKSGMTRIPLEEDIDYRGVMHHCLYYSIKKV